VLFVLVVVLVLVLGFENEDDGGRIAPQSTEN